MEGIIILHIINHTLISSISYDRFSDMKKIINTDAETDNIITEESFQYILIEIIDDVIQKRKEIHQRYQRLVKKVLSCQKSAYRRTLISKYLMSRVIRESDRAFNNGQNLAKNLCPSCNNKFESYNSFSDKLH